MTVGDLLAWSLFIGATSAGITTAVRALPAVQGWMFARVKPWACDICMSFWTTALVGLGLSTTQHDVSLMLACGPAYPLALLVLNKVSEPKGPPPAMPPLE